VPTGIVSASLQEAQREQRRSTAESCPHCGKPLSS
jgi:hypothetical protein